MESGAINKQPEKKKKPKQIEIKIPLNVINGLIVVINVLIFLDVFFALILSVVYGIFAKSDHNIFMSILTAGIALVILLFPSAVLLAIKPVIIARTKSLQTRRGLTE